MALPKRRPSPLLTQECPYSQRRAIPATMCIVEVTARRKTRCQTRSARLHAVYALEHALGYLAVDTDDLRNRELALNHCRERVLRIPRLERQIERTTVGLCGPC